MILEKFAFSFVFNLKKQNITKFSFISLAQNFMLCLYITTARHCMILHIVSTVAYQTVDAHRCPMPLPRSLLNIQPHQTAIFKSR